MNKSNIREEKEMGKRNQVLTEKELAAELGISRWTARGMRLKDGCPHFTVGCRIFYRLETVLKWLDQKECMQEPETNQYGKLRRIS